MKFLVKPHNVLLIKEHNFSSTEYIFLLIEKNGLADKQLDTDKEIRGQILVLLR